MQKQNLYIEWTEKNSCHEENKKNKDSLTTFLIFVLQKVLSCPHAKISKYFKRKLNVYNVTAIYQSSKCTVSCVSRV